MGRKTGMGLCAGGAHMDIPVRQRVRGGASVNTWGEGPAPGLGGEIVDILVGTTIIGAGVVGCALAWELSRQGEEVLVLEKNPGVTQGENQSSRNSGVIHAGLYYDRNTRPLKARLCVEGNRRLYDFCREHGVPHLGCGKLVVATREAERPILEHYHALARHNGVPVRLVGPSEVREMEPQVQASLALHLPSSGVVDATALVYRLHVLALNHGAQFLTGVRLCGARICPEGTRLRIAYRDGAEDEFLSSRVINAAGLDADDVARMVDPESPFRTDPVRSEIVKFYRTRREEVRLCGMNVYPTPRQVVTSQGAYFTVGVHLTPTLEIHPQGECAVGPVVTVGPLNTAAADKEDYRREFRPMKVFFDEVSSFFPGLRLEDLEPHQVGIQARLAGHQDWVILPSPEEPRWINLLGIDSPGLTGALAIARLVREEMLVRMIEG